MEYAKLGRSDLGISKIGFGCMSLKGEGASQEKLIRAAIDQGIIYFDTADLYEKGENEKLVGKAIRGQREKLVIATKVGNQWKQDGSGWQWNPSKTYILESVEASLQRLGTDYIDLYQLHGGTLEDPFEETLEAFEKLVAQGKIRYYGISSIRPNVIRRWVEGSNMVSVMMQYSLLDRRPEESVLPLLQEKEIGVLARGSLAQGLLVDKPAKDYLHLSQSEVASVQQGIQVLVREQNNPAGLAVRYVLNHPALSSAVVGIRTPAQLEEALNALDTDLGLSQYQQLQALAAPGFYTEHR